MNSKREYPHRRLSRGAWLAVSALLAGATAAGSANAACVAPPPGLVAWWQGEGDALDAAGQVHGVLVGDVRYGVGKVGSAFVSDGAADAVNLGEAPELQLQNFTIEAWVKRGHPTAASQDPFQSGIILGYGWSGYALAIRDDGSLFLTKVGSSDVRSVLALTDVQDFHHIAVSKSGPAVVFYLDGVADVVAPYDPGFEFSSTAAIGARGGDWVASFLGAIDELAIYNRALTPAEIQALHRAGSDGKCEAFPPSIVSPPRDTTVLAGETALFTVAATGSAPLAYQWSRDGVAIDGATRAALAMGNVQLAQAGSYLVRVSNPYGAAESASARLTVTLPPATVRVLDTTAEGGRTATVPITLAANGNENAVAFSVWFDANLLTFLEAKPGSGAAAASLLMNSSQAGSGRLGVALVLSSETTFTPGTNEILALEFAAAPVATPRTAIFTFQDVPTVRQLVDGEANALPAVFREGRVDIAATEFEGDVAPLPGGDGRSTIADWVQAGRMVVRLDAVSDGSEFERADCAPRASLGNGQISVTDWVQVGRYVAGLDSLTTAGGPTAPAPVRSGAGGLDSPAASPAEGRVIEVIAGTISAGQTNLVTVQLAAIGDENALAFSLGFDPAKLRFASAAPGASAAGAAMNLNTRLAGDGHLGLALARPTGTTFPRGSHEILQVRLAATAGAAGEALIALGDDPVLAEVSDAAAHALETSFVAGMLAIRPSQMVLQITRATSTVVLSWPAGQGFVLQSAPSVGPGVGWVNDPAAPEIVEGQETVVVPVTDASRFYRLARP